MQITQFKISADRTQLDLSLTDAASVASLRLWTDKTFKNFAKAINLTAKLNGAASQTIAITLADLGIAFFDGVYFIEAEDPDETSLEYAYSLNKYQECILDRIMYLSNCNECLETENTDLINAQSFFKGLQYALEQRFIDEILLLINTLNSYCSNDCTTCGKYKNVITDTSEDIQNPGGITIIVDGGSID